MRLNLANFKGRVPRVHPRLLPENFAQVARNTRLDDGTISPIRTTRADYAFGAPVASIYRDGITWLGFSGLVDVRAGPVAQDRLYYTGDGAPKMRVAGTVYGLALAAPTAAPTLTTLSIVDAATDETILYCYTNVTGFGEESAPSPTTAMQWSAGVIVRITGFTPAPADRNVTARRIYRSQTSTSGVTDLYFVAEIAVAVTTYDHNLATAPMNEVLPSLDYDVPRDTLRGLVSLPNGIMAAFDGKELFFSEPFVPHAWPSKYSLTTDAAIVGLAVFGSTLAVLTTLNPYLVQGTHPDSMVMERVDANMPCLSRRGIVDIGYAALYPSTEGLALVGAGRSEIVTKGMFTLDQWRALSPETIVAENYDGRYIFTFTTSQFDTFVGGTHNSVGADTLGLGTHLPFGAAIPAYDFGTFDSAFGEQRVGMIDVSGANPFFQDFDLATPSAMFLDAAAGRLYMLVGGTNVQEWDAEDSPPAIQRWRSRLYSMTFPSSFGAILVQTDDPVISPSVLTCRVYADGQLIHSFGVVNEPERLPGDFLASRWEIEIESNIGVSAIVLASTMEELVG